MTRLLAVFAAALFRLSAFGEDSWEEEALLLYNAGSPEINDLRARSTGNERLRAYAKALGQLHSKPLSELNALLARDTFDALFEANPNDSVGLASAYYLARINQKHLEEPDLEAARSAYRYIFETYPKRFFGELAFLKYLLIELYEIESGEDLVGRIEEMERLGRRLTIPDMIRGFHRTVGDAYLGYELSREKAYTHLKAAYEIDSSVPETQLELMLTVAELAESMWDTEVAISALQDFLKAARLDDRREEVALRIAALSSR